MYDTSTWETVPGAARAQGSDAYTVKVRGTMYLWGSAGITKDATFPVPLLLHIVNGKFGAPIDLTTMSVAAGHTAIGTLQAGERFSIPVQGIAGVLATSATDSTVACAIRRA